MAGKNKQLLSEAQVRQFMKLANLGAITPGFVDGLHENGGKVTPGGKHGVYAKRGGKGVKPEDAEEAQRGAHAAKDRDAAADRAVKSSAALYGSKEEGGLEVGEKGGLVKTGIAKESHGRGKKEGAAGYGHEDNNSRLEEQDDLDLDMEDEDLELADLGVEDEFEDEIEDEGPALQVSVDDFLAALEMALEEVMGEEVEVTQDEDELEDEELGGEELELGDEEEDLELQEKQNEALAMEAIVGRITQRVAERLVRERLTGKKSKK